MAAVLQDLRVSEWLALIDTAAMRKGYRLSFTFAGDFANDLIRMYDRTQDPLTTRPHKGEWRVSNQCGHEYRLGSYRYHKRECAYWASRGWAPVA